MSNSFQHHAEFQAAPHYEQEFIARDAHLESLAAQQERSMEYVNQALSEAECAERDAEFDRDQARARPAFQRAAKAWAAGERQQAELFEPAEFRVV